MPECHALLTYLGCMTNNTRAHTDTIPDIVQPKYVCFYCTVNITLAPASLLH